MENKKQRGFGKDFVLMLVAFMLVLSVSYLALAIEPTGASVDQVRTERAPNDTAETDQAMAGNVTELTI